MRDIEERFRPIANSARSSSDHGPAQCTYVNQQWLDLTGLPLEAALGEDGRKVSTPKMLAKWRHDKAFDRRESFPMEYRSAGTTANTGGSPMRACRDTTRRSFAGYTGR